MKLKEQRYFNSKGFVEKRLVYLIKGRLKNLSDGFYF